MHLTKGSDHSMCPLAVSMSRNQIILIIDDAWQNIQVLGSMLEMAGYEVQVATSGAEALEIAHAFPQPDLILLDVMMPGMDGFEVCQRLKDNPVLKSIPVVFISAIEESDQKVRAFRAGAVDYITKPFQNEEVLARVQAHLQLATIEELRREIAERKQAEAALQNAQDKLSALTDELGLIEERERRRIALAIHDEVVQKLALGKLKLDQALKKGLIPAEASVTDLQGILDVSMRELHDLSDHLSPPLLYELGLKAAIECLGEQLAGEHGFRFAVSGDDAMDLREDLRVTLFQMAQELLVNMVKHAHASTATVQITKKAGSVRLEVADDGAGFNLSTCREGFGLAHIRQRVARLGGAINISTAAGMGTSVVIEIPADAFSKGVPHESQDSAGR
jgi:two-component system, sensor histidine kinase and response regulator